MDHRSPEAEVWRRWYWTRRWKAIRQHQLDTEPLCQMCKAESRVTEATVCDHIAPHRGDAEKFWNGPFQSLCDKAPWRCHSRVKQQIETRGYVVGSDANGRPSDPNHPWNRP